MSNKTGDRLNRMCQISDELAELGVSEAKKIKQDLAQLDEENAADAAYIYERLGVESVDNRQRSRFFIKRDLTHAIYAISKMEDQPHQVSLGGRPEGWGLIVDALIRRRLPLDIASVVSAIALERQLNGGAPTEP